MFTGDQAKRDGQRQAVLASGEQSKENSWRVLHECGESVARVCEAGVEILGQLVMRSICDNR